MGIWRLATTTTLITLAAATMATAATIAIVAPKTGSYATLGGQVFAGAIAAAEDAGHDVLELDETCEAGADTGFVDKMIDNDVIAAVGFLCTETLSDLLPQLSNAGIPALTVAVRSKILMEDALRYGWPLFRMTLAEGDEATTIGKVALDRWKGEAIAIIDDGTIYGRELAGAVRRQLEASGLSPVFVDTYRPGQEQQIALVRRLKKAGATHVVVGGDRIDIAVIARDAANESIPLTLLGGDTMRAADQPVALRDGVMAVAKPDHAALSPTPDVVHSLRARGIEPEGYVLPAYAAIEVVVQASRQEDHRSGLAQQLKEKSFQTVIGKVTFDDGGELSSVPLRLQVWQGGHFVAVDTMTE